MIILLGLYEVIFFSSLVEVNCVIFQENEIVKQQVKGFVNSQGSYFQCIFALSILSCENCLNVDIFIYVFKMDISKTNYFNIFFLFY